MQQLQDPKWRCPLHHTESVVLLFFWDEPRILITDQLFFQGGEEVLGKWEDGTVTYNDGVEEKKDLLKDLASGQDGGKIRNWRMMKNLFFRYLDLIGFMKSRGFGLRLDQWLVRRSENKKCAQSNIDQGCKVPFFFGSRRHQNEEGRSWFFFSTKSESFEHN